MPSSLPTFRAVRCLAMLSACLLGFSGCKSRTPAVDDTSLSNSIQAQIASDSALAGLPIETVVVSGVATLSGSVSNDAQRTIAARDAAAIPGVKEVINNLSIYSQFATGQAPAPQAPVVARNVLPPPPSAVSARPQPQVLPRLPEKKPTGALKFPPERQPAPIERRAAINQPSNTAPDNQSFGQPPSNSQTYSPPPPQQQQSAASAPPPPPAPRPPTYKTVIIASGDTLPIRITQTLDSATTQPDTTFTGVVASDILADGLVAIPAGSTVSGHVDAVQEAAHFKGSALLTVSLVSVTRRGEHMSITTEPYTVKGKGRGSNTAEKTGGGAAVGAILGGIFGGGKGAAIGAAAGGGVGAGSNGVTRGQQVQIESESVVRFRLATPLSVRVRTDNNAPGITEPTLEHRPG